MLVLLCLSWLGWADEMTDIEDTGCAPWGDVLGAMPWWNDTGVPTDIAPVLDLAGNSCSRDLGWTLSRGLEEVAQGVAERDSTLGVYRLAFDGPLEPDTEYELVVGFVPPGPERLEDGIIRFTTGDGASAGVPLCEPRIVDVQAQTNANYDPYMAQLTAQVAKCEDSEVSHPLIRLTGTGLDEGTEVGGTAKFANDDGVAEDLLASWRTGEIKDECVAASQLGATGQWSEWSDEACDWAEIYTRRCGCSSASGAVGGLGLLLLIAVGARRRR